MDIVFGNKKLKKRFGSDVALQKKYGEQVEVIRMREKILRKAKSLADVPTSKPERRHQLKGKREGQFAVDLKHPYRLIFEPDYEPIPRKDDGGIDLEKVTKIKIIEVVDYH